MSAETQSSPRSRVVARAGAELFLSEQGDPANPTIVLVHGFPDTHLMWDELVGELAERHHTVAYGRRGYTPDRVAAAILRAIRRNPAVLPVAPEAHVARTISRVSPAVLRGLGRLELDRVGR